MRRKAAAFLAALLAALAVAGCTAQPVPAEPATLPPATTLPPETTLLPETTAAPLPEVPGKRISAGVSLLIDGNIQGSALTDGSVYTKISLSSSQTLTVKSETPFGGLYLIWDEAPGAYSICWDGGSLECGEYGFLHDYVPLPEAVTAVELRCVGSSPLCDVQLYTPGSAPDEVQVWLPPCEEADILVFPTHADDDALFFGPLISYYTVERQLKVQTAFMVEHTGYSHRSHERLNGLWAMGVRYYPILGTAPDTATHSFSEAMALYARSDILGWQVEQIRRFRPLVVVGHDLQGEYGNGGHKVNAHYLTRAIHVAADSMQYPASVKQYGTWQAVKLYLHLYPEHEWYLDVNTPMENDPQGRTPFEAAEDGFAAHLSQHRWGFFVQQDDRYRVYDCRPFGLYYTCVGFDTKADVMDHIIPSRWRN